MTENPTPSHLRPLAKVEGKSNEGKPIVLFLCTHNAGRSQMAMGSVAAMAEVGINISGEYPKPWTDEIEERVRRLLTDLHVPSRWSWRAPLVRVGVTGRMLVRDHDVVGTDCDPWVEHHNQSQSEQSSDNLGGDEARRRPRGDTGEGV